MEDKLLRIKKAIKGEVSINPNDLDYYSTDGGIFEIRPMAIVAPRDTMDVQNLVWTVNEINAEIDDPDQRLTITARGNGTDQGGGPVNNGIIVDFMRHMNHIIEIRNEAALVEPGCLYGRLQDELKRVNHYLPSYPASIDVCTIGGAVANNSAGEKTVKYGATRKYIEAIQVVLADGTITWLHDVPHHELDAKKNADGIKGSIYREIDQLINDNYQIIQDNHPDTTKESSGYALWKAKNGDDLDLAQIVTGSQGTLCLITAIKLNAVVLPDEDDVVLAVSYYDSLEKAGAAAQALHSLSPSALEIVDKNLITLVRKDQPELLEGLLPEQLPEIVLLCEFDDHDNALRKNKLERAQKVYDEFAFESRIEDDPKKEANLWKLRRSAAAVMWTIPGKKKALPVIEDGTVPPEKLVDFLKGAYEIFNKYDLEIAVWGHAGDADLHMQPFMDLSDQADREKLFKMTDDFYAMVHSLGGTAAGEHNDSIMRSLYREQMFGSEMEELFNKVKAIFDPDNIFNPHKKIGVDFNYVKEHLRNEYSIKSLEYLKRQEAQKTIDR